MTRRGFLEVLKHLRLWKRGANRAPHKPLLLLWSLGRIRQGERRLASYEHEVERPLRELLADFGPWRRVLHPENPFWHLQTEGIWELAGDAALSVVPGRSATRSALDWAATDASVDFQSDGIVTGKRTFQKFFTQEELRQWIERAVGRLAMHVVSVPVSIIEC